MTSVWHPSSVRSEFHLSRVYCKNYALTGRTEIMINLYVEWSQWLGRGEEARWFKRLEILKHCIVWKGVARSNEFRRNLMHVSVQARKIKKIKIYSKNISYVFSKKVYLIFREMELSSPKIKIFLIFNPKKNPPWKNF